MYVDKDHHVTAIRRLVRNNAFGIPLERGCLVWAAFTCAYLRQRLGLKAIVQAGSSSWPRLRLPEEDDGVVNTHYSYVYTPGSALEAVAKGELPEVHVWVGVPSSGEIVDLTARYLPGLCRATGMAWTADEPDYLWDSRLPPHVRYEPSEEATVLALHFMRQMGLAKGRAAL